MGNELYIKHTQLNLNGIFCHSCKDCKRLGKEWCDRCDASCCINNMNEHKKLFELVNDFPNKVNNALEYAKEKVNSLDDDLRSKDIYVSYTSDIYQYLENMKEEKSNIQNECSNWNTNEIRKEYEEKFLRLGYWHEEEVVKIRDDFQVRRRELEREMENKKYYHNQNMNSKRNERNTLENRLNQIKRENPSKKERELNSFKEGLRRDKENNFNQQKNNIDREPKYQKIEKKLEYSEEEKKTMEQYLNEINKIYDYSKVIPEDLINNLLN